MFLYRKKSSLVTFDPSKIIYLDTTQSWIKVVGLVACWWWEELLKNSTDKKLLFLFPFSPVVSWSFIFFNPEMYKNIREKEKNCHH